MAKITIESTSSAGTSERREFELDTLSIGAGPKNQLVLPDEYVASEHLRIFRGLDGFCVEDLGDTNGTWLVRGAERVAVTQPMELESGDELELGRAGSDGTRIRVSFAAEPSSTQIVEVRPLGELGRAIGGPDEASARLR